MFLRKFFWFVSVVLCFGLINVSAQDQPPMPKMISGGVVNGKANSLPKPEYPAAARAINAGGAVNVAVTIDEAGNVESAEAVSGHPLLRAAAVEAAKQAKFPATKLSGTPVKVKGVIIYNFVPVEKDSGNLPESVDKNQDRAFIVGDSVTAAKDKTFDIERSINGGVINGKAISLPVPVYPAAAAAIEASGAVNVRVKIDTEGNIIDAEAVSGHPLLRDAAVAAARQAKFKPTLLAGNPVNVTGIIIYNFNLSPPPNITDGLSDKNQNFGIGLFLSFFREADSNVIDEMGNGEELNQSLREMMTEIPAEFISEKESLEKLAAAKGYDRQRMAAELSNSFKKFYNGADLTEYEIGQTTGVILVQVLTKGLSLSGKNFQANDVLLKENLVKLETLMSSTSIKMSADLQKKLRDISSFANSADLNSRETFLKLFAAVELVFDSLETEN